MENATSKHLILLASLYGGHLALSHWRVSFLVRGDGGFFKRLGDGKTCTVKTAGAVLQWFSDNWPDDLEWPRDIVRPAKTKRAA